MKTLLTKILALSCIAILMLSSCKKDETRVVSNGGTQSVLTASTTTPVLTKSTLTATSVTFTATEPTYGFNAVVTNTLQIDVKGNNFAKPTLSALNASAPTASYTVVDFNNLLLSLNLPTGTASQIEVRVKFSLSDQTTPTYSNVVTLTVTPFALTSYIYVPGAYQGWNPATADSLQSATGNGVYTGIINFSGTDQNFKITPAKNWNVAYGDAGGGKISTSGGNLVAPAAGLNQVTVDLNANTITFSPVAHFYSVIGDAAQGWGTDVDMKFNNGTLLWTLTTNLVSTGAFKFRQDHQWTNSWGWPKGTTGGTSIVSSNDDNLTVAVTGTYAITFGNVSADNSTATYTAVKQ